MTAFSTTFYKKRRLETGWKLSIRVTLSNHFLRRGCVTISLIDWGITLSFIDALTTASIHQHIIPWEIFTNHVRHKSNPQMSELTFLRILSTSPWQGQIPMVRIHIDIVFISAQRRFQEFQWPKTWKVQPEAYHPPHQNVQLSPLGQTRRTHVFCNFHHHHTASTNLIEATTSQNRTWVPETHHT